jgi:hypothetical protein
VADQLTLHQRDDLPDDVIDVKWNHFNVGFFRQRPDALDHLTCPLGFLGDPFHSAARFGWGTTVEPTLAGRRSIGDGGEQQVHFMGDRGRKLAQGCYARDVRQVGLRIA